MTVQSFLEITSAGGSSGHEDYKAALEHHKAKFEEHISGSKLTDGTAQKHARMAAKHMLVVRALENLVKGPGK